MSELTQRPIARNIVSDEALRAKLAERGAPPAAAEIAIGLYAAARAGEFETVDPTLQRLLGRPPVTMGDVVADKLNDMNGPSRVSKLRASGLRT